MRNFAAYLFRLLERRHYCPDLKVIVIGMWKLSVSLRICFLKGHIWNPVGGEMVVAQSVPGYQLRELGLEILDFDPGEWWINGIPGKHGELRTLCV